MRIFDFSPTRIVASPFMRRAGFICASMVAGTAAGFVLGSHTGVRDGLEAGQSIDAETLSKALAWKPEIASTDLRRRREIAQLLDEVRSARAQLESLRHEKEALRPAERLRALEAAREAGASRLDRLETRLGKLERTQIDPTPTGALPKTAERKDSPRPQERPKAPARTARDGG